MILPDVNVLVYALDDQSARHDGCRKWLRNVMEGKEPFAMAELSTMLPKTHASSSSSSFLPLFGFT